MPETTKGWADMQKPSNKGREGAEQQDQGKTREAGSLSPKDKHEINVQQLKGGRCSVPQQEERTF